MSCQAQSWPKKAARAPWDRITKACTSLPVKKKERVPCRQAAQALPNTQQSQEGDKGQTQVGDHAATPIMFPEGGQGVKNKIQAIVNIFTNILIIIITMLMTCSMTESSP